MQSLKGDGNGNDIEMFPRTDLCLSASKNKHMSVLGHISKITAMSQKGWQWK